MLRNRVLFFPFVAAGFFVLLSIWFRNRLPDSLAIHFGPSGRADGFMDFWPAVVMNALLILVPALLAFLLGKGLRDKGLTGIFVWLPIGMTLMFFLISIYLLLIQLDVPAGQSPTLDANFFLLVFVPVGLLLLLLLRKPRVRLEEGRVVISSLGIAMASIQYVEIEKVGVESLRPIEFGGWGLRVNLAGDVAFLPSAGPAVAISRKNGNRVLVRSDRAEQLKLEIERNIS